MFKPTSGEKWNQSHPAGVAEDTTRKRVLGQDGTSTESILDGYLYISIFLLDCEHVFLWYPKSYLQDEMVFAYDPGL